MSRFIAPNLAALGEVPAVVPVDFEAIKAARDAYLIEALAQSGIVFDVANLETDPLTVAHSEGGGFGEMLWRQRVNEAIRALSLVTATGADLDHIAATYYGVSRRRYIVAENATPPAGATFDAATGQWVEGDATFRALVALAPEAFSTAGPEGAYIFHALELDGTRDLADALPVGFEDGAVYGLTMRARPATFAPAAGTFVQPAEVLLVVLPTLAFGAATQALLDRVYAAVTASDVRPLADAVVVEPATVVTYAIDATITYQRGADPAPLVAEARKRVEAYVAARRRIGVKAERLGIGGACYVSGIEAVTLTAPATDVGGGMKQAPHCTGIMITAVQSPGSWSA